MGAEEIHWGFTETNNLHLGDPKFIMSTKLNHKNGDKTMSEDLLIEKEDKIGSSKCQIALIMHVKIVN